MNNSINDLANQPKYPFYLPNLPYKKGYFIPYFSQETFNFHYGKHHNSYVLKLNDLLKDEVELHNLSLEEIILKFSIIKEKKSIFNNAAQVWNHTFYWHSISPNGGGVPNGKIKQMIEENFDSFDKFRDLFLNASVNQFGSGWSWLVLDDKNNLNIVTSSNAETPITEGLKPIITCDLWEHAYYIDHRNKRSDYVSTFLNRLINWEFANDNLV